MKAGIIAGLALLWRLISWAWSILIAGAIAGVLGNAAFTYFTTGGMDFKDPRTLAVGAWLNTHLAFCFTLLTPILVITLCSFLAHHWRQRTIKESRRVHNESLVVFAKGIQRALDELNAKPVAPLTPPSPAGTVIQETIPPKTMESTIDTFEGKTDSLPPRSAEGSPRQDWGEAPDVPVFFGRTNELATLEQWIVQERCRLVAIVGMGGIGKTDLSLRLAQGIQDHFEYVIWRRLLNAPKLIDILADLIKFLSNQQEADVPDTMDGQISRLLHYLRQHRCLLILDNVEMILQGSKYADRYRQGYEDYGQLFRQVAEIPHQSCLLLTSREKPPEIARLDRKTGHVRSLELSGLDYLDGKKIFAEMGSFSGSDKEWRELNEFYNGNPLALELAAKHISEVFFGNISEFLKEGKQVFADLRSLLDWYFDRLSGLEKEIMYWFAINREPISLTELKEDIVSSGAKEQIPSTLQLLQRLLPLEKSTTRFTLQPVLIEYMTDRLVEQVVKEIRIGKIELLNNHALLKVSAKDHVRESQSRLILKQINERLLTILGSQTRLEAKLKRILSILRAKFPLKPGYAGGNVLNLLCQLKADLTNYDFSYLSIWQVYLRDVTLPKVNFAHANFLKSVFTDTFGMIRSVAFSPTGDLLAAGTSNNEVQLWSAATGAPVVACKGHIDCVWSVAFSPDGKTLASGSEDQTVRLWEVSTGYCLKVLQEHAGRVWSVAFSPDGNILASGSQDQSVHLCLWKVGSGQHLEIPQEHAGRIWSVAFSPDGNILTSGSEDQTMRLWEASTGRCLKILQGHTNRVYSVAFSPDGNILASGSEDLTIRLWEASTGRCLKVLQGHAGRVRSVAFSPDGKTLASGGEDRTVRLWEASTGRCLKVLQGHTSGGIVVAFSPDGKTLASGGEDQTMRLWEASTGHCLQTLQSYTNSVYSVTFSPDGNILASAYRDRTVRLWEASTGHCLKVLQGHTHWVRSVAFSPDGKALASGSEDLTVRLWEVSTGHCLKILQGHTDLLRSVAFSPDGNILASACEDLTVRLWEASTGHCLKILQGHTDRVWSVAFSPDGNILASACDDQTVRLWEVSTGHCVNTLQGHTDWVRSVAFSPDGNILASGSQDQTVRLWEVSTGQCLKVLQGHTDGVYSVTFSSGRDLLASGSNDGTIKFWDVLTSGCLKTLRSDRPYERMNVTGVKGLTEVQKATIRALGAIEDEEYAQA